MRSRCVALLLAAGLVSTAGCSKRGPVLGYSLTSDGVVQVFAKMCDPVRGIDVISFRELPLENEGLSREELFRFPLMWQARATGTPVPMLELREQVDGYEVVSSLANGSLNVNREYAVHALDQNGLPLGDLGPRLRLAGLSESVILWGEGTVAKDEWDTSAGPPCPE